MTFIHTHLDPLRGHDEVVAKPVAYVLSWVSYDECYHHGIWAKLEDAMAEAQRLDDEWDPYPGWDDDASPGGSTRPKGPLSWEEMGDAAWGATGCGFAREWRIHKEEIR